MRHFVLSAVIGLILCSVMIMLGIYAVYFFVLAVDGSDRQLDAREILVLTRSGIQYVVAPAIFALVTLVVSLIGRRARGTGFSVLISLLPIISIVILGLVSSPKPLTIAFFVFDIFLAVVVFGLVRGKKILANVG